MQAPDFQIKAVASGREISRAACAGRPLLLLFHDQSAEPLVRALQERLRARYSAQEVLAASLVNMHVVPRFLRGAAEKMMAAAYHGAAKEIPSSLNPADHVIILPDWTGSVCQSFGVHDGGRQPASILLDGDWRVRARVQGPSLIAETMTALDVLLGETG